MLLRALCNREQHKGGDFDYVGLRYMNVYGTRQDDKGAYVGVVARMLNALDAGMQPVIHGDGSQAYDFVDVRDCARANILAMQSSASNHFYNVGTGIKTSIIELTKLLRAIHPNKREARFELGDRPFVRNRVGAVERARREIDFVAATRLEVGLRDVMEWRAGRRRETQI
jgi:UDP-glucose 4-epimerase